MSSTDPIADIFRSNLKSFRELRGHTQAELGARAGIAAASISHFETGQRLPALDSLIKLADALEVPIDALLGRVPVEAGAQVDPIFLRASRASADTLAAVRRVTAALLGETKSR